MRCLEVGNAAATITGTSTPLLQKGQRWNMADQQLRIYRVGVHLVEFRYAPDSFRLGVLFSLMGGVTLVLGGAAWAGRRVFRGQGESSMALRVAKNSVSPMAAQLLGRGVDPGAPEAQDAVARHHAWLRHFWEPVAESYRGLGKTYAEHPEFRAYYGKYAPGLADWMCRAMDRYAETLPGGGAAPG